jgi:hypothetical protein
MKNSFRILFLSVFLFQSALAIEGASAQKEQCGRFYFEGDKLNGFPSYISGSVARVFDGKSGNDYKGSAVLIDSKRRLLVTAAHVVGDFVDLFVDFPVRGDYKRFKVNILKNLTLNDIDVAVVQLDGPVPAHVPSLELQTKDIEKDQDHYVISYPKARDQPLLGNAKPSPVRNDACWFDFRGSTTNGDSGGAVVELGSQLSGLVIQSDNYESQGKFVTAQCFFETFVNKVFSEDPEPRRALLDVAENIAQYIVSDPPVAAKKTFKPPKQAKWVSNVEMAILFEGIIAEPDRFCELVSYWECPILLATYDRLGLGPIRKAANAENRLFSTCEPAVEKSKFEIEDMNTNNSLVQLAHAGSYGARAFSFGAAAGFLFEEQENHLGLDDEGSIDPKEFLKIEDSDVKFAKRLYEIARRHYLNEKPSDYVYFLQSSIDEYWDFLDKNEFEIDDKTHLDLLLRINALNSELVSFASAHNKIELFNSSLDGLFEINKKLGNVPDFNYSEQEIARAKWSDATRKIYELESNLPAPLEYEGVGVPKPNPLARSVFDAELIHLVSTYAAGEVPAFPADASSTNAEVAKRHIALDAIERARAVDTAQSYRWFLRQFPESDFSKFAKDKMLEKTYISLKNDLLAAELNKKENIIDYKEYFPKEIDKIVLGNSWPIDLTLQLQIRLNLLGYDAGVPDGRMSRNVQAEIVNWQKKNNMKIDGSLSRDQYSKLVEQTTDDFQFFLEDVKSLGVDQIVN